MRFVAIKSDEQQDIQALHRIRQRVIEERTALVNQRRGLVLEYGIVIPQGINQIRNRIFRGLARLGKTIKGWFFGMKLHLIVNEKGQLHNLKITRGNTDDRTPLLGLAQDLEGLLFGDRGYIKSSLFQQLYERGLKLVTGIKKSMNNKLMPWIEKVLLRKRSIIETVFSVLKHTLQLEHTRHRSATNALVHILSTLVTYCFRGHKPAIK